MNLEEEKTNVEDFYFNLKNCQELVKDSLEKIKSTLYEISLTADHKGLRELLEYHLTPSGKLVRSTLTLLLLRLKGSDTKVGINLSVAIELLHNGSLLHDDVIDEGKIRRGKLTVSNKYGNIMSVLGGDYLILKAVEALISYNKLELNYSLINCAKKMITAQFLELSHRGNIELSLEEYLEIIKGKTASLFEFIGEGVGIILSIPREEINLLSRFTHNFGIIFQVIDDLIDFSENTGKKKLTDLKNGIITLPLIFLFNKAKELKNRVKEEGLDNEVILSEIPYKIVNLGIKEEIKAFLTPYIKAGEELLTNIPDSIYKSQLLRLYKSQLNRVN